VDAEKREGRVGYWIDEVFHLLGSFRAELVILASER
jgi:hypothetical protein